MNQRCLENIPYASVIGFILLLFGCGVFSGTLWEGSDRVKKIFNDNFYKLKEADYTKSFGISYAIISLLVGVLVLIYGTLASGTTRTKVYNSSQCQNLGRCCAGLLIGCCYILLMGWLLVSCAGMVMVTSWVMLSNVCYYESEYWSSVQTDKDQARFTYSLNLSNYGIYPMNPTSRAQIDKAGDFQRFCSEISTIGPLFTVGFVCSILVVLSLLTFISALAANMVRLQYHEELSKFRGAAHSSMVDLTEPLHNNSMATHSSYPDPKGSHYLSQPAEMQPLASVNYNAAYPSNNDMGRSSQYHNYKPYDRPPNTSLV